MFEQLGANIAVFAAAAAVVWIAGTGITRYADLIARRTAMGYAAAGVLLLAGVRKESLYEAPQTAGVRPG